MLRDCIGVSLFCSCESDETGATWNGGERRKGEGCWLMSDIVRNSNEQNAAYAADGYARVKGTPGVRKSACQRTHDRDADDGIVLTNCGVGELSAINGIAGAYSESVKIIHIVGTTPSTARKNNLMVHHSLGEDPDHMVSQKKVQRQTWYVTY